MKMRARILLFLSCLLMSSMLIPTASAGDRGIEIGLVNITQGEQSKECKRLFELLQMDVAQIFWKEQGHTWGWNKDSKMQVIPASALKGAFGPMIMVKKASAINDLCEKREIWDGVIVFEYDKVAMKARLKLFDNTGKELALIKLPLEKGGAMKNSLLKHVRRGAVYALASSVKFSP